MAKVRDVGVEKLPKAGSWTGQTAVIVGGGPSLKAFDFKVLQAVKNVIVVNKAYENVPTAPIFYTKDNRFVKNFCPTDSFQRFGGLKIVSTSGGIGQLKPFMKSIDVYINRINHGDWARAFGDGFPTHSNSGVGALMIADILGASTVYMLGFDCRSDGQDSQNYHSAYPTAWRITEDILDGYRKDFERVTATHLKHMKITNVINPDYESAVTCWPMIEFEGFYTLLKGALV